METNERIQALVRAGLPQSAVAAILDLDPEDVQAARDADPGNDPEVSAPSAGHVIKGIVALTGGADWTEDPMLGALDYADIENPVASWSLPAGTYTGSLSMVFTGIGAAPPLNLYANLLVDESVDATALAGPVVTDLGTGNVTLLYSMVEVVIPEGSELSAAVGGEDINAAGSVQWMLRLSRAV